MNIAKSVAFYRRLSAEAPPYQWPGQAEVCPAFKKHGHDYHQEKNGGSVTCVGCGKDGGLVTFSYEGADGD